jgi:hypothetical protein
MQLVFEINRGIVEQNPAATLREAATITASADLLLITIVTNRVLSIEGEAVSA